MGSCAGCVSVEWATKGVLESLALSDTRVAASAALVSERRQGLSPCLRLVVGCWCPLAPESTLRHLWTSQNVRRRSVLGSGVEFTGKGVRCACGGDACAYHLVGCWDVARPLGEGHIIVLHRGLDVGERRCLPTGARRVRNPHRSCCIDINSRDARRSKPRQHGLYKIGAATWNTAILGSRAPPRAVVDHTVPCGPRH
eukprot:scaffold7706_cov138-Isochrysis_galbana.AAC.2